MSNLWGIVLLALALSGCFPGGEHGFMQRMTAGRVPCSQSEIEIVSRDRDSWTARCHGTDYYCAIDLSRETRCSGRTWGSP